jgi:hypothetical protein
VGIFEEDVNGQDEDRFSYILGALNAYEHQRSIPEPSTFLQPSCEARFTI